MSNQTKQSVSNSNKKDREPNNFSFTITKQSTDNQARLGIIHTPHGDIHTPAFIPVATKATIKSLTPQQINDMGFDSILSNTYHLYLQPGPDIIEKGGKIQKFMAWHKPMFTDSGGFQVFSLSGKLCTISDTHVTFRSHIDQSTHVLTPEKSMQIQRQLGADLIFAFDQCLDINADYPTTQASLKRTHNWETRSVLEFNKINIDNSQALYGIVQGGRFTELREESAKFVTTLNTFGIGIGSIFGDPKEESVKLVTHALKHLPEHKPKHLLGIGSVDDIFYYVPLGIDTFDCVLPTRLARIGHIFTRPESGGNVENKFRIKITNAKYKEDQTPLDPACTCYTCTHFTKSYIHHLEKSKELLFYTLATIHNLSFFKRLMDEIQQSIQNDSFKILRQKWIDQTEEKIEENKEHNSKI